MSKPTKPTTHDVAERAQVSQMTVSRVLRGKGYASKAVTEKVLKAVDEIGYVRNNVAGSLADQRTNLVGVIVPSLSNSVFTEVLSGFDAAISASGLQSAIGVSDYDPAREYLLVRDMLAWRPAGIVLAGLEHDERTRKIIKQNDVPVVEIMDVDGEPISKCVGLSHKDAATDMAMHLIEQGHSRFGYVGSALQSDARAVKRFCAFKATLEAHGFKIEREATSSKASSMLLGRQLTEQLLINTDKPIAIYYSNDDLASGGLLYSLSKQLSVPGDVAIASFNGLEFLEALPMQITTLKSPRFRMGNLAGKYLLGEPMDAITQLQGELIIGDTT